MVGISSIWSYQKRAVLFVLLLLLSLVSIGCTQQAEGNADLDQSNLKSVTIQKVVEMEERTHSTYIGEVVAKQKAILSFEVGGRLNSLEVEQGDYVQADQVLASLDETDYLLHLEQTQIQYSLAQTKYQKLLNGSLAEEIEQTEKEIEILLAQLTQAENHYARTKRLVEEGALPHVELETSETTVHILKQQLEKAQLALSLQLKGARDEDLALHQMEQELMKNSIALAEQKLSKTTLRAPFAGVVSHQMAERGETLAAGIPVLEITQVNPLYVQVDVPARVMSELKEGEKIEVFLPEIDKHITGRIAKKQIIANPETKNYTIEIEMDNEEQAIFPGLLAEVKLLPDVQKGVWVPLSAVVNRGENEPFVFIYDQASKRVSQRKVHLGELQGDHVRLEAGVAPGENLVVQGAAFVADGDQVHVKAIQSSPLGKSDPSESVDEAGADS